MFTFKRHPRETGLRAVGNPHQDVDIKLDKKKVGWISARSAFRDHYAIHFHVMTDDGSTSPFKNITLKVKFKTEEETRIWLQSKFFELIDKFKFYKMED